MKATKIVATLGPASSDLDVLSSMIEAGVDVVRLNFSHGTADDHAKRANFVREAAMKAGKEIAIMADLQGPKIRVGKFADGKVDLENGAPFILDANCAVGNLERVGLDYKELPNDVKKGDLLLLADGLIQLRVQAVRGSEIHTTVEIGGELSNNKGINKLGGGLSAPALTAKDMDDIKSAVQIGVDYIAVSFPKSGADMYMAKNVMAACGGRAKLVAKIERAEAIVALDEIIAASDSIMVARGDLAVEVGNAAVPALQKRMIKAARAANKTVITATQMMESMITNPVPTRAEVSDVANAVLDGTDAVMLSAESAVGKYPVETVRVMAAICVEAERSAVSSLDTDFLGKSFSRIDQSIAMSALFAAYHVKAKAVASLTKSGATALWMSRYDCGVPIYALTPEPRSARKMAIYRGVYPMLLADETDPEVAQSAAERLLLSKGIVNPGDFVIITNGDTMGKAGGTNTMKIIRVGDAT
jgi:pyruvate kinase